MYVPLYFFAFLIEGRYALFEVRIALCPWRSSTPANYHRGNHNSRRADRRQFSDLIERSTGQSGGQSIMRTWLQNAESELHKLSPPCSKQAGAEPVLSTSWGCGSGACHGRYEGGAQSMEIQDQSICQQTHEVFTEHRIYERGKPNIY